MSLAWPWALLALLLLPLVDVAYRRLLARQATRREELAAQGLVLTGGAAGRWRRVTPTLLLLALAVMILALSRPIADVPQPRREGTVVLAFDVSTSMAATDVKPTRLDAAKAAASAFVDKQPSSVNVAVVAFGGTGLVTARPTTDKAEVRAAINRLRAQGDTSLGSGILSGLSAIAGKQITVAADPESGTEAETRIGHYGGTAIVLLTDGENTGGPDPVDVADLASAAGVRIEPIGLGTPAGSVLQIDGFSIATALDEPMLQRLAQVTGGTYHQASDAAALAAVYDSIELTWSIRTVPHEITSYVAAVAGLLLLAGASIAVARQGRVV